MSQPLIPWLASLVCICLACQGPPGELAGSAACEPSETPASRFRLFAVGHKITLQEAESAQAFENSLRATVTEHVTPYLAGDRPNILVFPESVALSAVFLGRRGQAARQAGTSLGGFTTLLSEYVDPIAFYARLAPDAAAGRLLMLAVTDPMWRAFDTTFSRLAQELGVYVAAGIDVGDVQVATDPELIALLGDPERPDGAPVYWVPDGRVYNQVIFYGPDGALLGKVRKQYLTDPELIDLDLSGGLPERLGPVQIDLGVDGLISAAAMISRDAWMQDALERQALRGARVLMQNEAYSGGWAIAPDGYTWPPDNLKRSGWAAVQKFPEFRVAVAPMLVGNFFDIVFDGQSFAAVPGESGQVRRGLLAQEPDTGWAAIAPWVEESAAGDLEEQRAALRLVGEALRPGGERANQYAAGSVYVDVNLPDDDGYLSVPDARPGAELPVLGPSTAIAPAGVGRQRHAAPVVLDDGTLVVAWEAAGSCAGQIWVTRSADRGATWSEPVPVAPSARVRRTPAMVALPDGELVLAWQEVLHADSAEIRVARSHDAGATWSPPVPIDGEATVEAWKPALAVDRVTGDVHLVFVDRRGDPASTANWRIYGTRSDDGGSSWAAAVRRDPRERPAGPDTTYTNEWAPAVAAHSGQVAIAYTHRQRPDPAGQPSHDVFVVESPDRGVSWGEPRPMDAGGFPERLAADVVLAMAPDRGARVLWSSLRGTSADADIALAVPGDAALRFAPDVTPGRDQWFPAIAPLPDGAWAVAWQDFRNGSNDIYLSRLDADGFGPALRVDDAGDFPVQSWRPRIAAGEDGTVLVVWEDSRTGHAELRAATGLLP